MNRKNDDKPMDVLVPYFRTKPCRDTRNQNRDGHAENMWLVVTVWLPCESSRVYFLTSLGSPGFQAPYSNVMGQISPSDDFLGKNWKMSPSSDDFPQKPPSIEHVPATFELPEATPLHGVSARFGVTSDDGCLSQLAQLSHLYTRHMSDTLW